MEVDSPNGFSNVSKCVDSSSSDSLLVSLEQLKELKTDPHPFLSRHKLSAPVSYPAHQVNAVLLYLLMSAERNRERERMRCGQTDKQTMG